MNEHTKLPTPRVRCVIFKCVSPMKTLILTAARRLFLQTHTVLVRQRRRSSEVTEPRGRDRSVAIKSSRLAGWSQRIESETRQSKYTLSKQTWWRSLSRQFRRRSPKRRAMKTRSLYLRLTWVCTLSFFVQVLAFVLRSSTASMAYILSFYLQQSVKNDVISVLILAFNVISRFIMWICGVLLRICGFSL